MKHEIVFMIFFFFIFSFLDNSESISIYLEKLKDEYQI